MLIKLLFYSYILLVFLLSTRSYKKGVYLVWFALFLFPPILLQRGTPIHIPFIFVLMLSTIVCELVFSKTKIEYFSLLKRHIAFIVLYIVVMSMIILGSETVPFFKQLLLLLNEAIMLLFGVQTYLMVKVDSNARKILLGMIGFILFFNIIYFIYFELFIGVNPAGWPLYVLLGVENNEFLVDMIDSERGSMSLRAQTVYGHPLSLGQYMLVLLPLFFMKNKKRFNSVMLTIATTLIVVSGSRGAIAPAVLVLCIGMAYYTKQKMRKTFVGIAVVVLVVSMLPQKTWKDFTEKMEPFIAGLVFWDDDKQKENHMGGSSMEMRLDQWDAAQKEISSNPMLGRGLGYREWYQKNHHSLHPRLYGYESVLLLYLVERGWIGLLFFFFLAYYIYSSFRKETSDPFLIMLVFTGYIISIVMTGVRVFTLIWVFLSCSIICGYFPKCKKL